MSDETTGGGHDSWDSNARVERMTARMEGGERARRVRVDRAARAAEAEWTEPEESGIADFTDTPDDDDVEWFAPGELPDDDWEPEAGGELPDADGFDPQAVVDAGELESTVYEYFSEDVQAAAKEFGRHAPGRRRDALLYSTCGTTRRLQPAGRPRQAPADGARLTLMDLKERAETGRDPETGRWLSDREVSDARVARMTARMEGKRGR